MVTQQFEQRTRELIDSLKTICAAYGLGNDGNEFKIITQVFLYKFLNDKFAFEAKKIRPELAKTDSWEAAISAMSADDLEMLQMQTGPDTARLKPEHFISHLFGRQNAPEFAKLFDDTLRDIAITNNDIFAVKTDGGAKITLFDRVSEFITDPSKRDAFCRAIINKLGDFSFERIFNEKYDFYAALFEYLIKDYNKDSGGKYAEYYTPHAVAKIMAAILMPEPVRGKVGNVSCYDPSAGSGTLLMNIAHAIGEQRCSIYSQDISQKSSSLLRLNLILNNLVHSIPNIIQGNTMLHPYHREAQGQKNALKKFDYIVSNPPFKMDFSDFRNELDTKENQERFFAGIPNIPKQAVDKMAIYQLFLQHIIYSLKPGGKAHPITHISPPCTLSSWIATTRSVQMSWAKQEFETIELGDARLNQRAVLLAERLGQKPGASIPAACENWAETAAAYRFLRNHQANWEEVLSAHARASQARIREHAVVLCIQDTTELDYHGQAMSGLGPLSFEAQRGLYLHPTYVVSPEREPLGVTNAWTWAREFKKGDAPRGVTAH